ncbi:hypothetical protein GCM10010532_025070 [Dactylosporangium siamense]|uniref:Uncharacterized protein n=1 Tax=Dactylosporangium siamense TaxID=685454 RepID=A0A919UHX5_9ACTN|nr:hypothetical protein Dsi01nite_091590 [Dactylosporangium siamense]
MPGRAVAAATADLTVHAVGRDGAPSPAFVEVIRTDRPAEPVGLPFSGTVRVPLERGTYLVSVEVQGSGERTWLLQPSLRVDGPVVVTADARAGRPVAIAVPRADARPELLEVRYRMPVQGGDTYENGFAVRGDLHGVYFGPLGPSLAADGFRVMVAVTMAATGVSYLLGWMVYGQLPAGLSRVLTTGHLATVENGYGARVHGGQGTTYSRPAMPGGGGVFAAGLPLGPLPASRVEHYNVDAGGITWRTSFEELTAFAIAPPTKSSNTALVEDGPTVTLAGPPVGFRAPLRTTAAWNTGVAGPSLAAQELPEQWVSRNGDTLVVAPRLHGDGAGHPGLAAYGSARTALYRDGVLIHETDTADGVFTVPPSPGRYRLEVRAEPVAFGTVVQVAWTFRSEHVPGPDWRRVPLRAVSFDPALRADGTAPAGRVFRFPFRMTTQAATAVRPAVEVSYDDGRTWFPAVVTDTHVAVAHPSGKGWVTLRATAADFEQVVLRAYPFGP